jgi:hypothetical protein
MKVHSQNSTSIQFTSLKKRDFVTRGLTNKIVVTKYYLFGSVHWEYCLLDAMIIQSVIEQQ